MTTSIEFGLRCEGGHRFKEDKVAPHGGGMEGNNTGAQVRDEGDEEAALERVFFGKKKKKGGVKIGFELLGDEDNDDEAKGQSDEVDVSKKSSKGGGKVCFALLGVKGDDDGGGGGGAKSQCDGEDGVVVSFIRKKPSKGSMRTSFAMLEDEDNDGDGNARSEEDEDSGAVKSAEVEELVSYDEAKTSKNNKKKKGGSKAEEQNDLDKILEELGEGPVVSKPEITPPSRAQEVGTQSETISLTEAAGENEGEGGEIAESAAAKKEEKEEGEREREKVKGSCRDKGGKEQRNNK